MIRYSLRQRLSESHALVGLRQTHPNPLLAEMAGMCGYDFLLLDGEHGVFSERDYPLTLQALAATASLGMVRLPGHDTHALGRYLDMGAHAVVVPHVSTSSEAKTLVRAMSYPPVGTRSVGASVHRASRYGMDAPAHIHTSHGEPCLIVIIETADGVSNIEDILGVDGIDGALIGPSDLSAELGCAGDFEHPSYCEAVDRIERAASLNGKFLGTAVHASYSFEVLIARGYRLLLTGADMPLIREAMCTHVAKARACLQPAVKKHAPESK